MQSNSHASFANQCDILRGGKEVYVLGIKYTERPHCHYITNKIVPLFLEYFFSMHNQIVRKESETNVIF